MSRSALIGAALLAWGAALSPGASPAAEPLLALSLNLGLAAEAVPGAPLIVTGSLASSAATGTAPLRIAPARGTWLEAFELALSKEDGSRVAARFAVAGVADTPALELAWRSRMRLFWTLPAKDAGSLAPGRYTLRARLAVSQGAPGSWTGTAESPPLTFEVPPSGGSEDTGRRRARALLTANLAAVDGDFAAAESGLRALISQDSGCVAAHRLLAEVLLARGAPLEAFLAANEASGLWSKANPAKPLPPPEITDVWQRAVRRLLETVPAAAAPPTPGPEPAAPPAPSAPAAPARPPERKPESPPGSQPKPATPPSPKPAPSAPTPSPAPADPRAKALKDYGDTLLKGDALMQAGDFFEAVRVFEQAWRIRYNNKLDVPAADLDDRLARARKARDEKQKR